jgi:hypothetical protein
MGYVMGDSLDQHAPSDTLVGVPTVDLEADVGAGREVQLRPWRSPKHDDTIIEEVVDGKNERPYLPINHGDPAEVMRAEQLDALRVAQDFDRT